MVCIYVENPFSIFYQSIHPSFEEESSRVKSDEDEDKKIRILRGRNVKIIQLNLLWKILLA